MPSRLLDVGPPKTDTLRLCCSKNNKTSKYVALSHCWGMLTEAGTPKFCTTDCNIKARQNGFDVSELPKTFRDAAGSLRIWTYNTSGLTLFASYKGTRKIGSLRPSACKTATQTPIVQSLQRQPLILMQGSLSLLYAVSTSTYKIPQADSFMSVRKSMISTTT
jgi:hypothetical protein